MRFRGTFVLLILCAALGAYVYFYEIKGGEKREKAKQEENQIWKVESNTLQQIDLTTPELHITADRIGEKEWKLTAPRPLDADAEELNRLASSASDISRENVVEPSATDLARFGLNPPQVALQFKTKDGKEYRIRFGNNNPTGNSTYAALEGKSEIFTVASYVASNFRKKLDDLRNRAILNFEQFETQSADLITSKGAVQLIKENDRWYLQSKERWAADTSAVNSILGALSSGKVKEFFDENPDDYSDLGFDKPVADVRLKVGKNLGIKHLILGLEKSKLAKKGTKKPSAEKKDDKAAADSGLYLARDESRRDLFFVDKDFLDKLLKTPADLRDKALASFQRWDIDSISLTNSKGTFQFSKFPSGGDWVLGDAKKKTKWDAVNGILDGLEKQVKEFIDTPASMTTYGLDKPIIHVVLKQGGAVKVDCAFGKEAKDGVYAQIKGESTIKIADKESLDKLNKAEADFLEPPAPTPPAATAPAKK